MNVLKNRIEQLGEQANNLKLEVGKPCSVSTLMGNGVVIGAARIAGRVRYSVNGVYTSKAKALAAAAA